MMRSLPIISNELLAQPGQNHAKGASGSSLRGDNASDRSKQNDFISNGERSGSDQSVSSDNYPDRSLKQERERTGNDISSRAGSDRRKKNDSPETQTAENESPFAQMVRRMSEKKSAHHNAGNSASLKNHHGVIPADGKTSATSRMNKALQSASTGEANNKAAVNLSPAGQSARQVKAQILSSQPATDKVLAKSLGLQLKKINGTAAAKVNLNHGATTASAQAAGKSEQNQTGVLLRDPSVQSDVPLIHGNQTNINDSSVRSGATGNNITQNLSTTDDTGGGTHGTSTSPNRNATTRIDPGGKTTSSGAAEVSSLLKNLGGEVQSDGGQLGRGPAGMDISAISAVGQPSGPDGAAGVNLTGQATAGSANRGAALSAADQIGESVRLNGMQTGRRIVVRLDPPELGLVRLTLRSNGRGVQGVLEVQNPQTLTELRQGMPPMIERLAANGVQMQRLDIIQMPQTNTGVNDGSNSGTQNNPFAQQQGGSQDGGGSPAQGGGQSQQSVNAESSPDGDQSTSYISDHAINVWI